MLPCYQKKCSLHVTAPTINVRTASHVSEHHPNWTFASILNRIPPEPDRLHCLCGRDVLLSGRQDWHGLKGELPYLFRPNSIHSSLHPLHHGLCVTFWQNCLHSKAQSCSKPRFAFEDTGSDGRETLCSFSSDWMQSDLSKCVTMLLFENQNLAHAGGWGGLEDVGY